MSQLTARQSGQSLSDYYLVLCKQQKVKPNSAFRELLPLSPDEEKEFYHCNLSGNYLGDRGFQTAAAVLSTIPALKIVEAKDNGLRNAAIEKFTTYFKNHPNLEVVDFSQNWISTGAGSSILLLLKHNDAIKTVRIEGTKIEPELRLKINDILAERQG